MTTIIDVACFIAGLLTGTWLCHFWLRFGKKLFDALHENIDIDQQPFTQDSTD